VLCNFSGKLPLKVHSPLQLWRETRSREFFPIFLYLPPVCLRTWSRQRATSRSPHFRICFTSSTRLLLHVPLPLNLLLTPCPRQRSSWVDIGTQTKPSSTRSSGKVSTCTSCARKRACTAKTKAIRIWSTTLRVRRSASGNRVQKRCLSCSASTINATNFH
jgi:hypothetical protein